MGTSIRAVLALLLTIPIPAAAAAVEVTARLRTGAVSGAGGAYLALVPEWRPSRQPLVEQIAKDGVARFRVPPGKYWLIGSAPGTSVASTAIEVSRKTDVSLEVFPLQSATGFVRDAAGAPIAGARVSTLNAAIPPLLGHLSELAARHLSSQWQTTSGDDGAWSLPLPKGRVPLFIEASGHAAQWSISPEDRSSPLVVSLARGATLTVATDREDPDLVVTLSREEKEARPAIPADRQPLLWARPAERRTLTWSALPPGSYTIYAKYPEPRYFMQKAAKVGAIVLAPGDEQRVQVTLPPLRRKASAATALFVPELSPADLGRDVQAFGGDAQPLEHFVEEAFGGSVLHLKTTGEPGLFATTENLLVVAGTPPAGEAVPWTAAVHWRADAGVQFRSLEKELQLPRSGVARLRDCDGGGEVTVPFEIRPNGFARVTAAADCRSLVLSLDPFEPVVTGRTLQRGEQSLGEIVLRAAATADVRVTRDPGGDVVRGATVKIVAAGDEQGAAPLVVAEAVTDDAGWAHFAALPAHRELRAIATAEDGDKSDAAALRLAPRERGVIDPLPLPEPAALIIDARIDPAFLSRFPSTRVANISIRPADPFRDAEKAQQNVTDGAVPFGPLTPGRWLVTALVNVANNYAPFELEPVELKAGESRRLAPRLTPNLFEGIVTSEGKPVAAKVTVDDGNRIVGFQSDGHGLFQVVLEQAGVYDVAATRLNAQGYEAPVGKVAFTDPSRRIEIAIPRGATIVARARAGDQPVPRTFVTMSRRTETGAVDSMTMRTRITSDAGETTFEQVAPGVWTFVAEESTTGRKAERSLTIRPGENESVELVLAESAAIEGTIRDVGGMPLPRAMVECLFVGRSGHVERASAFSDADGRFSIALVAPAPPSALCSAIGPNGSVDAFRTTTSSRVDFSMPAATGALRIADWGALRNAGSYWLVAPDGRPVNLSATARMFGQSNMPLAIPALAAGRWKLVRVDSLQHWLAVAQGLGASLPAEAELTMRPGAAESIQVHRTPAP